MKAVIRARHGVDGLKYQVIFRGPGPSAHSRTFRRLTEAKAWALREERQRDSASLRPNTKIDCG